MKVCPECKSRCFDDMDTCYGCMHKFTDNDDTQVIEDWCDSLIPEFFELDSCPIVEEISSESFSPTIELNKDPVNVNQIIKASKKPNHAKGIVANDDNIVLKIEIPLKILKNKII